MKLRGIEFGNVFLASGALNFFSQGWWFHKFYNLIPGFDFSGATFIAKTTTLEPRAGNMPLREDLQPEEFFPRCIYVDFKNGIVLNAVGLSGPGAKALLEKGLWQRREEPFFISFMAVEQTKEKRLREMEAFVHLLQLYLDEFQAKIGLEINVSCPNTNHDTKELAGEAEGLLIAASRLGIPLILKVNVLIDPSEIKDIAKSGLCDAISVSNTIPFGQLPELVKWQNLFEGGVSPLQDFGGGGLSSWPLFPLVRIWVFCARYSGIKIPIIAGGGVMQLEDVITLKDSGASAVSLGSVLILRPWRVKSIVRCANNVFGGE